MPVLITFCRADLIGGGTTMIGGARAYESVAVGGTSTGAALSNELVRVVSTEGSAVRVAFGPSPDATAATEVKGATSAAISVAPGSTDYISVAEGDRIAVSAG